MKLILLIGALVAPLFAGPAAAAPIPSAWNGVHLMQVDADDFHHPPPPRRNDDINAGKAMMIVRQHGFQPVSVHRQGDDFLVTAKRGNQLFIVRIDDDGRFRGAQPVRHRDDDDDDD
jgi:hypothetical protein